MCAKLTALIMKEKLSFHMYDVCTINLLTLNLNIFPRICEQESCFSHAHVSSLQPWHYLAFSFDLPTWAFLADLLITVVFKCLVFPILATWTKYIFLYFSFLTHNVNRKRTMSVKNLPSYNIHNSSLELSYLNIFFRKLCFVSIA